MSSTTRPHLVVDDPAADHVDPTATRAEVFTEATGPHLPPDAQRMGLSSWTAPGLAMATSLSPRRRSARILAWVMLVMILGPLVLAYGGDLLRLLGR